MINRRTALRSLIAALFVALLSVVSTQDASAQTAWKCGNCDFITVSASSDLQCKFELCVKTTVGSDCQIIVPGSTNIFKCVDYAYIYVTDCNGNPVFIDIDCNKGTQIIPISANCCIEVCATYDSKGCLYVKISNAKAPCGKCP